MRHLWHPRHFRHVTPRLVWTTRRVDARIRQSQWLDGPTADDVRIDDLVNVGLADPTVPDRIGIHDHCRAVLALIETARAIGTHSLAQPSSGERLLERLLQRVFRSGIATPTRVAGFSLIAADEDVFFERRHLNVPPSRVPRQPARDDRGGLPRFLDPARAASRNIERHHPLETRLPRPSQPSRASRFPGQLATPR